MPPTSGFKSITDRAEDVRQTLLDLLREAGTSEGWPLASGSIEDVLDRFKLWSGNIGALHHPYKRLSLETRLASSPEVQDQICEQLDDLQESLQDLLELCSTSGVEPGTDGVGFQENEAHMSLSREDLEADTKDLSREERAVLILDMVSQCLNALFRIGILVRKATGRDRFDRALQQPKLEFPAEYDISYVKQKYPKLSSKDKSWLASRLGIANAKRRHFIQYSRDHQARLNSIDVVADAMIARQSSNATTFVAARNLDISRPYEEDDSMSLVSAATGFDNDKSLKLPSLAYLSPDGKEFECPICFTLQSFSKEKSWKIHVYHDLKAYNCMSGGKECEQMMFGDRDSWFDHELKHHYSLHVCTLCGYQGVATDELKQHTLLQHKSYPKKELEVSSVIEHGRIIPSRLRAQDCPFCDNWALILSNRSNQADGQTSSGRQPADVWVSLTNFKRHVATHQEQLAMFAMPKGIDDNELDSCGNEDSLDISSKHGSSKEAATEKSLTFDSVSPEVLKELGTTQAEIHGSRDLIPDFREGVDMRSEEGEDVAEGVKGQGFKRIMEEPEPIQDSDAFDENEPQTRQRSASAFKPNDTANLFAYGHEMAAHSQHGFYGGAKPVAPPSYDMPPYSRAPPPLTEVEIAPPASALPEEERLDQVLKEAKALRISETTLLERQKADEAQKSTKPDFKVREDAEREFMARMEAMNQTQKEARMATGLSRIAAEQAGRERIEEERKAEEERKRMEAEMAAQTARVTPGDQLDDKSNKTHTTHYKNAMNAAWSYFGSASDKADGDQVSVLRPTPTMDDHIGGYSAAAFPNNSTANPSQTVDERYRLQPYTHSQAPVVKKGSPKAPAPTQLIMGGQYFPPGRALQETVLAFGRSTNMANSVNMKQSRSQTGTALGAVK